jgi:hypothetical protein
MHLATLLLSGITWDPFIRGVLIVVTAFLLLPGSVYLLLATNTGVKLGFLIAMAGLFGWISLMAAIWSIFGIGMQGRVPAWKIQEVITGDQSALSQQNTVSVLTDFPKGWTVLPPAKFSDPLAAADKVLAPNAFPVPQGQTPPKPPINFTSPYKAPTDYIAVAAYDKNKDAGVVFTLHRHKFYRPGRPPHYIVLAVQAVRPTLATGGPPPKPVPDATKPITWVVMVRDLGSVRQPSLVISVFAGILFLIVCDVLHRRDKQIMAAKAAALAGAEA